MSKPIARIAILTAFLIASVSLSLAQGGNQGTIAGTVTDSSGALVPGAEITATNTSTRAAFKTVSTDDGFFEFALLPVGTYDIDTRKQGFNPLSAKDVKLTIGAKLSLTLELKVSSQGETVVVNGEAPVVETARTQVSSTIDDREVANLPTNGRNFIDFALLTAGVSRDVRLGDLSFAGQRGTLNSLTVDGTDNNNTFFGQTLGRTGSGRAPYQFSQDAVQEFQVNTNGYSAEFGRAGGAVINVVTKSGTNQFHGTGFEFYRDRSLNANTFFNNAAGRFTSDSSAGPPSLVVPAGSPSDGKLRRPVPALHVNQFGGNIGGPIVKDRAFFFFDYDGQRRVDPVDVILGGTRVGPADPNFAAQQLALSQIASHTATYPRLFNQNVYLLKGDWQITGSNRFSARWNHQDFNGGALENSAAPGTPATTSALDHTGNSNVKTDTLTFTLASVISNRIV